MSDKTFHDGRAVLLAGDCLARLKDLPDCSVDSVVTDPPYHLVSIVRRFGSENAAPALSAAERRFAKTGGADRQPGTDQYGRLSRGFMGKTWDGGDIAFRVELWAEVFRVLKPGGHVLAFSGTRTYHRMACAIEDAGFEIRDRIEFDHDSQSEYAQFEASLNDEQQSQFTKLFKERGVGSLSWKFGTGFPKSHNVKKGAEEKVCRCASQQSEVELGALAGQSEPQISGAWPLCEWCSKPIIPDGWGTALKPAYEPICLGRKPLIGTVAENVLAHRTGAINIDGCRVPVGDDAYAKNCSGDRGHADNRKRDMDFAMTAGSASGIGRHPANVVHDGSPEVVGCFPAEAGAAAPVRGTEASAPTAGIYGERGRVAGTFHADSGSAARFFSSFPMENDVCHSLKSASADRGAGGSVAKRFHYSSKADADDRLGSKHPTVKPVDLMRWLVRLVTPPGGTVLDPFAGTGTTGHAALLEGFNAILIEREEEYRADIARRMALVFAGGTERAHAIVKARGEEESHDTLPLFGGGGT